MIMAESRPAGSARVEGKDERLEVLSQAPLVLGTPLSLLAGRRITDKHRLFVRNIQDLPEAQSLEPQPIQGWEIELTGLIDPPRVVIHAEELVEMDQVEHEMVLQCSGNGRALYAGIPGLPWNQGAVANVSFTGVPLSAVLDRLSVRVQPQAKYVTAEGKDLPMGRELPDMEHSLPVADVLERSILALKLNGEDLPGIHGGPVRLVTPGFYGTMHLKWLQRLRFEVNESPCFYHATEYRVPLSPVKPGERFRFTLENSRPTWSIRLMSYILDPLPGARVTAGPVPVSGVAYNDGSVRLESVLVSADRGQSWRSAEFQAPNSPYAWYQWTTQVELQPGVHEIWSRAIDALGRSQPLDGSVYWNPNGYEWTGMFHAEVIAT